MTRKKKDVTDAELALLQVLWESGGLTIRDLTDAVYPEGGESDYATVKKLLARLESKGFVHRDRSALAHVYHATRERDALIGNRLRDLADDLCGGSTAPLLMHLLENQRLSSSELEELQGLVNTLSRSKRKRK